MGYLGCTSAMQKDRSYLVLNGTACLPAAATLLIKQVRSCDLARVYRTSKAHLVMKFEVLVCLRPATVWCPHIESQISHALQSHKNVAFGALSSARPSQLIPAVHAEESGRKNAFYCSVGCPECQVSRTRRCPDSGRIRDTCDGNMQV